MLLLRHWSPDLDALTIDSPTTVDPLTTVNLTETVDRPEAIDQSASAINIVDLLTVGDPLVTVVSTDPFTDPLLYLGPTSH